MPAVSDLLDRVYKSTNYTDRFHIVNYFNDAQSQLTDDAKMDAESDITLVVDQANYSLPTDFKSPIALIDGTISSPNAVYDLININEDRFGYAIFGDEIYIKPTPAQATTLKFYYYKSPAVLVDDDDTPEFDSLYHYLLASYAIYMISLLPESNVSQGMADRAKREWDEGVQSFIQSIARKRKRQRVNQRVVW